MELGAAGSASGAWGDAAAGTYVIPHRVSPKDQPRGWWGECGGWEARGWSQALVCNRLSARCKCSVQNPKEVLWGRAPGAVHEPLGRGAQCELPPPPDPHPWGFSPPPLFQLPPVPMSPQPLTIIQQLPVATAHPTGPPHLWGGA